MLKMNNKKDGAEEENNNLTIYPDSVSAENVNGVFRRRRHRHQHHLGKQPSTFYVLCVHRYVYIILNTNVFYLY